MKQLTINLTLFIAGVAFMWFCIGVYDIVTAAYTGTVVTFYRLVHTGVYLFFFVVSLLQLWAMPAE